MADDQPPPPYRQTATTHIRSLSSLSNLLPTLLTSSATSLSQLTNAPIAPPSSTPSSPDPYAAPNPPYNASSPASRKSTLQSAAHTYFSTVVALGNALHAQIDDLERAKVIPADEARVASGGAKKGATQQQQAQEGVGAEGEAVKVKDSEEGVRNAGLGSFDVGVLNARVRGGRDAGDAVERVKGVLEEVLREEERKRGGEDEMEIG